MKNDLDKILKELYLLDPGLKQHEAQLKKIITSLSAAGPDIKINQEFVSRLKKELLTPAKSPAVKANVFSLPFFAYAGSSAVAILLFIVAITFYSPTNIKHTQFVLKSEIAKTTAGAFGTITMNAGQNINPANSSLSAESATTKNYSSIARSSSVVDAQDQAVASPMASGMGGGGVSGKISGLMPLYEYINYNYQYAGEDLPALTEKMTVYKKVITKADTTNLASQMTGAISDGLVDLAKLQNTEISNLAIAEDREFGYIINFNSIDSSFSLYANWNKWPQPDAACRDDACYQKNRLKAEDIPSDTEVMAIAAQFAADYNINLANYAEPIINNNWRIMYEQAADKTNYYIPDTVGVVYPLKVDGQKVYDTNGQPIGLTIEVNSRYKKVYSVYNLMPLQAIGSDYDTEQDTAALIKQAENGGLNYNYKDPNAKTETVQLDTPVIGLISYYQYDPATNESKELYIPAYIFTIKDGDKNKIDYYRQRVVVPLVKGAIAPMEEPVAMPLSKPPDGGVIMK